MIDAVDQVKLDLLVEEATTNIDIGILGGGRSVGVYAMFSGGYDSLTSTAITAQHPDFSGVIHINTGIGIERTREFVRETCQREGWPLIEKLPAYMTYEEMVLEHGFPGPGSHGMMYRNLKERAIRAVVYEIQTEEKGNVVLTTGVRTSESQRRMRNVSRLVQASGNQIWVAPIYNWTAIDTHRYVALKGYPTNPASDLIHMSGECLCGSFATPGELDEIAMWFPEAAAEIRALEGKAAAAGVEHCRWGWGSGFKEEAEDLGPLCSSCEIKGSIKEIDD